MIALLEQASSGSLRDFLYLDVDIARSLYAQLDDGLLEHRSVTSESARSSSAAVEGKVPFLADAKASGDIRWTKSDTETRTLHDHLFSAVESAMIARGAVATLLTADQDAVTACNGILKGTSKADFVLLKGRAVLKDFRFIKKFMEDLHPLAETAAYLAAGATTPEGVARKQAREQANQWTGSIPKEYIKKLSAFIDWMHGDRCVLQMRPLCDLSIAFETDLEDRWLRFSRESLRFRFGSHPRSHWTVFGQLAGGPISQPDLPSVDGLEEPKAAVDALFTATRDLLGWAQITPPVIPFVPVAVYRNLTW